MVSLVFNENMLSFKILLCFIALNKLCIQSNKCLAMSFTARYEPTARVSAITPLPIDSVPINGLTALTAAASIQINEPKPKHIDKMQTILLNITLLTTSISLKWRFIVTTKNRIKRLSTLANVERQRRSLEWVIKVRQYGTFNVNVYHVKDEHNSIDDIRVHNQTYNYTIKGLQPLTAYELCIHSTHTIADSMQSLVNAYHRNNDICKEIVTPDNVGHRVVDITMASAISSASTTVIIVVMFCCCRKSNDQSIRTETMRNRRQNKRKHFKYHRIWKWLDRSPPRSYMTSSSMTALNSKMQANRPILNPVVNSHEFYINPEDIKCITGKNVRVFTKKAKPMSSSMHTSTYVPKVRNNISTTSLFRRRYARPNSWPFFNPDRTWLKTQSNPNISTNSANKLWFHSLSSDVNFTTSLSNEVLV